MSGSHTQGHLHVGGNGTIIYGADGWGVANATVFHGRTQPATSEANARRLVACWNACDGISTADLETAGRLAAADEATLRNLQVQRDHLLAVVEHIQRCIGFGTATIHYGSDTWSQIDSAITKTTGGAR